MKMIQLVDVELRELEFIIEIFTSPKHIKHKHKHSDDAIYRKIKF